MTIEPVHTRTRLIENLEAYARQLAAQVGESLNNPYTPDKLRILSRIRELHDQLKTNVACQE
jgi:hypothetical protein